MSIYSIYKNEGETPLEVLDRVRIEKALDSNVSMTYAGRLDPLASGILIVLTGEDVHKKDDFNGLSKVYEFEILFGFGTDTGDVMGKVESYKVESNSKELKDEITKVISSFKGKQLQTYPMYSSKTVDGIPLWQYAREGKEVIAPTHEVEISDTNVLGFEEKSANELLQEIKERIGKVKGDFRQQEILEEWENLLQGKETKFLITQCVATVSSGTYIRKLCEDVGEKIGVSALAWRIERTEIIGK
ncbi:MAG: hypothetical protein WCO58_03195 [bacterium]